jgi:hypothetical protein
VALYNLAVAGGLIGLGVLGWKAGRRAAAQLARHGVYQIGEL